MKKYGCLIAIVGFVLLVAIVFFSGGDSLSPEGIASNAGLELPSYECVESGPIPEKVGSAVSNMGYVIKLKEPVPDDFVSQIERLARRDFRWKRMDSGLFVYSDDNSDVLVTEPVTEITVNLESGVISLSYTWPDE